MDKIATALKKLSTKERESVKKLLEQIETGELRGLDVKKLKSREDIFRVRKGDIRVMYRVQNDSFYILAVERRSEKIYRA